MFADILALLFGPSAESVAQEAQARAAQEQWARMIAAENLRVFEGAHLNFLAHAGPTQSSQTPGFPGVSNDPDASAKS